MMTPPLRHGARTITVGICALAACALIAQVGLGAFGAAAAPAAPLISSAPLKPTISTRATVAFDRIPGLTYECSLDAGAYAPCPSPVSFGRLSRSLHVFRVRARKPAGAASSPSSYSWAVVAPRRQLTARARTSLRPLLRTAPIRPWISRNATFAWLLKRSSKAECRLDGRRWRSCANPKSYRGLELGTHVFRVRARRGHRRSSVNRFAWTIIASPAPPAPTVTSGPEAKTTSPDATFTFDVVPGSAVECRLDGGPWVACSSPVVYVGLVVGTHEFCVRAVNAGGVVGPETCVTWTILMPESSPEPSGAFTISGSVPGLLYPGSGSRLPLTVSNPYDFDLRVWGLAVSVRPGSSQVGCDGPTNLRVIQSNTIAGSVSIVVPARASVTLPAQRATAPVVTMFDLATSQDACKNAVFTFAYSGAGTRA